MAKKYKRARVIHNGHTPIVDQMAYFGFISPVMALPQAYIVWQGKGNGVSLITWATFFLVSVMWLFYGIKHKLTPIIAIQILWILVNAAVVLGLLVHRTN